MRNPNVTKLRRRVCLRCGYKWVPRIDVSRVCPQCKSPYWDRKRLER